MKNKTVEEIQIGEKYYDEIGELKVLCLIDKHYLVARRPRCAPFISTIKDFKNRISVETK